MYKVIDGSEFGKIEYPGFYREGKTEKDYVDFLRASQSYFVAGDFDNRDKKIMDRNAYDVWVNPTKCVEVEYIEDRYEVRNNGYHRAYVAQKYNFKILVRVERYD